MTVPGDVVRLKVGQTWLDAALSSSRAYVVVDVTGDGAAILRDADDLAGLYLFAVEQEQLA